MDFLDKVVIITGASRGIGKSVALKFAEQGAKVVVNYCNDKQSADEVVKTIIDKKGKGIAVQADISSRDACEKLAQTVVDKWETVHILVNNAGIARDGLLMGLDNDDWDKVMKTNLEGNVFLTKAVLPYMMMQKFGRIINISSVSADNGRKGQISYSASKGAINSLTKVLALEVASKGITVNAIAPGMIETDMSSAARGLASKQLLAQIPLGRYGQPEEIAQTTVFLASDKASYITGETLRIDGGLTLGIGI